MCLIAVFALSVLASLVQAQDFIVPRFMNQCESTMLSWIDPSGEVDPPPLLQPPYTVALQFMTGYQPNGTAIFATVETIGGTYPSLPLNITWVVDIPAGKGGSFTIGGSSGTTRNSMLLAMESGPDSSCLGTNPGYIGGVAGLPPASGAAVGAMNLSSTPISTSTSNSETSAPGSTSLSPATPSPLPSASMALPAGASPTSSPASASSEPVGTIAGGIVGGLSLLLLVSSLLWCYCRPRLRKSEPRADSLAPIGIYYVDANPARLSHKMQRAAAMREAIPAQIMTPTSQQPSDSPQASGRRADDAGHIAGYRNCANMENDNESSVVVGSTLPPAYQQAIYSTTGSA